MESCVLCYISPDNQLVESFATFGGLSLCEKHLTQTSEAFIDGYSITEIIKDSMSGNF